MIASIEEGVYRINTFVEERNLGFNQYLLVDEKKALIHSGTLQMLPAALADMKKVIEPGDIDYLVISHFESDECGSLQKLLEMKRDLVPVCSEVTARQLVGFGISNDQHVVKEGARLELGRSVLRFINYPSEMHLWDGILAYEERSNILFSADLYIRRGRDEKAVVDADPLQTISQIDEERIPSEPKRKEMVRKLSSLNNLRMIAPGHGPVLRVRA